MAFSRNFQSTSWISICKQIHLCFSSWVAIVEARKNFTFLSSLSRILRQINQHEWSRSFISLRSQIPSSEPSKVNYSHFILISNSSLKCHVKKVILEKENHSFYSMKLIISFPLQKLLAKLRWLFPLHHIERRRLRTLQIFRKELQDPLPLRMGWKMGRATRLWFIPCQLERLNTNIWCMSLGRSL